MQSTLTALPANAAAAKSDERAGKYLTFIIGKEEFGVGVLKVREIMGIQEITAVPQTPPYLKGVINLRGKVIPVIDLRLKFGLPSIEYTQRTCIIVVQVKSGSALLLMGIVVDEVSEVITMASGDIEDTPDFGASVSTLYSRNGQDQGQGENPAGYQRGPHHPGDPRPRGRNSVKKAYEQMTIGIKITQAFGALIALTAIQGVVTTLNIGHMNRDMTSIVEGPLPGLYSMGLIQGYIKDEKAAMVEHIGSDSPEQKSGIEAKLADLETKTQAEMKVYQKTIRSAKGQELFDKLAGVQEAVPRGWAAILPVSRALKTKEALALWNGGAAAAREERARLFDAILEHRKLLADEDGQGVPGDRGIGQDLGHRHSGVLRSLPAVCRGSSSCVASTGL